MSTTWDPTNFNAEWTLSSGNLVATYTASYNNQSGGFATGPGAQSTDNVTFKVTVTVPPAGAMAVGLGSSGHVSYADPGDVYSVGAAMDGTLKYNGFNVWPTGLGNWVTGDVITVTYQGGSVWFRRNSGPWNGDANASPGGSGGISLSYIGAPVLPTVWTNNQGASATADFSAWTVGAGGGATQSDPMVVDPFDFGAKGDAFSNGDGTVTNNVLTSPSYTFTAADTQKELYINGVQCSNLSLSGAGLAFTTPASFPNGTYGWLIGTDDTAAIAAAIAHATTMNGNVGVQTAWEASTAAGLPQGGTVQLRSGHAYMVSNASSSGQPGCIVLPRRVGFRGSGAGVFTSSINVKPGSSGHVICNQNPDGTGYVDFLTIANLVIYANKDWNPNQGNGVHLYVAGDGYAKIDACNRMSHIHVYDALGNGFFLSGRGESYFEDLNATYSGQYGFNIEHQADAVFVRCNAGGNHLAGIRVSSSACQFVGCKAFNNGGAGTTFGDCANWYVTADNPQNGQAQFTNCLSQDSTGSGWVIESGLNVFTNCASVAPHNNGGNPPAPTAGFHITGPWARMNTFGACLVSSDYPAGWGWTAGDAVHIDDYTAANSGPQKNRGQIYTLVTTTNPQGYSGGATFPGIGVGAGGPGATNGQNTLLSVDGVACT